MFWHVCCDLVVVKLPLRSAKHMASNQTKGQHTHTHTHTELICPFHGKTSACLTTRISCEWGAHSDPSQMEGAIRSLFVMDQKSGLQTSKANSSMSKQAMAVRQAAMAAERHGAPSGAAQECNR